MKTKQFYYPLPTRLIAQHPSEKRGEDRMMVLHRDTGMIEHRGVADIVEYLNEKDLLVVNDMKVFPARLLGTWSDSPGAVEVLMVSPLASGVEEGLEAKLDAPAAEEAVTWSILVGSGRPSREGQVAVFGPNKELEVRLVKKLEGGLWRADFICSRPLMQLLDEFGHTPVPPYVHREGTAEEEQADRARYQTIYAREVGSVAAPTAGLHFTPEIFAALEAKGVKRAAVTLHVGPGTFRPVKCDEIEDHQMDFEVFTVPPETAEAIAACKARRGRVVCVGSTTVRTLETVAAAHDGKVVAGHGASNIFIYPPYTFKVCDAMLTNFHLPQSTLLMMVSALAGRERILCAYAFAVQKEYRFFSYGDCMLIV
ncbi:MAG: tRNA preQ1(34) S-adenosylmethionine ribosyltransferase-isomerase QueA [Kiritimatiellae bacterium]|nr:tRNA preQ1(34) S-adenosylmethionine ribosyltransferase-isomerase QueA [Kiritimatiellia bacterium]